MVRERAGPMPAKKRGTRRKGKLTAKQLAQRKYAAKMRSVRARARTAPLGRGRIAGRRTATALRRKYGLKKRR